MSKTKNKKKRSFALPEGRWCGFGPYYAMFPVKFAKAVVLKFSPKSGAILDPFCGRGTVPFVSMVSGRKATGIDLNPVAWIFSSVKTNPFPNVELIEERIKQIFMSICSEDTIYENEFQQLAWDISVFSFLKAARRMLDWKDSNLDRTIMAFILVYLHAKLGNGISNQLRQSKAMSPEYSIRWWKKHNMRPPYIDVVRYFRDRIRWRYSKGIPLGDKPNIFLGDSATLVPTLEERSSFDLLFTSPPYYNVTNYKIDNWIRLWMLGGSSLPECDRSQRYSSKVKYTKMLYETLNASRKVLKEEGVIYIRTDTRKFTYTTTETVLKELWPKHAMYIRREMPRGTQTRLFGDHALKPGETDLLLLPHSNARISGFRLV